MENNYPDNKQDRRSRKHSGLTVGLWALSVSYGAASFKQYGAASIGLGLALLCLSVICLSQEIKLLSKVFGRRKGEGNER